MILETSSLDIMGPPWIYLLLDITGMCSVFGPFLGANMYVYMYIYIYTAKIITPSGMSNFNPEQHSHWQVTYFIGPCAHSWSY